MFRSVTLIGLVAGILAATVSMAQAPDGAPAGSTGQCRDGSYWTGATKKGACRGHKGVQDWYAPADATSGSAATGSPGSAAPTAPSPSAASKPSAMTPAAAAPATPAAPAATPAAPTAMTASASKSSTTPAATAAPGGGPGLVWVNTSSNVYHCPPDKWYGKTKNGAYMSEADALAKGDHADHGKACSK